MSNKLSSKDRCSALVVVDMQNAYFNAGELEQARPSLTENCNRLISQFRSMNRPVVFIRTAHSKTGETWTLNMHEDKQGFLFEGTTDVDILDEINKGDNDTVITKLRDSAFYATILEQFLASHNCNTIVLAGVSTQSCIAATAADAYARNIRVVLAEEAIGTHDITYHESTLALLEKEYRQERMTVDDIKERISS